MTFRLRIGWFKKSMHYAVRNSIGELSGFMNCPENEPLVTQSHRPDASSCKWSKTGTCVLSVTIGVAIVLWCIYFLVPAKPNTFIDAVSHHEFKEVLFLNSIQHTLVPIYIQRTGMKTLVDHIIHDSDIEPHCQFRRPTSPRRRMSSVYSFDCLVEDSVPWLISPVTKMFDCGKNPDWTAHTQCTLMQAAQQYKREIHRTYHFITMLRDPVQRFISEYMEFKRGNEFVSKSQCNGESRDGHEDISQCYQGFSRANVTMDAFLACPDNAAKNRQSRMMADLRLVNCSSTSYSTKSRGIDEIVLKSAVENIKNMPFFGLMEYQQLSQKIFEKTFTVKFRLQFRQVEETFANTMVVSDDYVHRIETENQNDVALYSYAKSLFFERAEHFGLL